VSRALFAYPFAVVDVETTGFDARGYDRIIEVAVVHLDERLRPTAEFSTLVDPQRDVTASWVHGITDDDVDGAPTFEEIAALLVEQLADRVVVAHNAPFDLRFLGAEFERLGHSMPGMSVVDTLRLTRCKLAVACERYGVVNDAAHMAVGDAHATGALLRAVIERDLGGVVDPEILGCDVPAPRSLWPAIATPASARPPRGRAIAV
jgi:DNA polymerase III epsilon subunit family exonuclease